MADFPQAVVLVSGGMDSSVTAAIAAQSYSPAFLHASYGQRTEQRERRAFEEISDFYKVAKRLAVRLDHFKAIGGSALTDSSIAVPESEPGHAVESNQIPVTYVPFRNAHFLSVAVSWAEVIGAKAVFIGAVAEDSSGYPDCRPAYYDVFRQLVRVGTRPETEIAVETPVISMRKSEIVRTGQQLGAPLHLTWSCYQHEDVACGVCDSCRLRLRAFAEVGITDPIPYRIKVER
jgi:7-cyano-7-deazaguanine synthase